MSEFLHESEANMVDVLKHEDRGTFDHGWLKTFHTFSFATYHNPHRMNFGDLRVINEDYIQPGEGFDSHSHADMEIVTYVCAGALAHRDSMGNGSAIYPGEVQYMSAGSGVTHSEYNSSEREITHILQIWILPREKGAEPRYDQKPFRREDKRNRLCRIASPDGREASIAIRQDAHMFASVLEPKNRLEYTLAKNRRAWVQLIRGEITVNGRTLSAGDGVGIQKETEVKLETSGEEAEFLLFDLR